MDIPAHLLPDIACSSCSVLLSRSPVAVLSDGRSICGEHQVQEPRNVAYEALAQLMRFPCRFKDRGCPDMPVWDSGHEEGCGYGGREGAGKKEKCSVCRVDIYNSPRYECLRGHKICQICVTPNNFRCQLCKSKITNEIIYLCKFFTFGCKFKSNKDCTNRHEIDCDLRGYACPFATHDCKWSGPVDKIPTHLKTTHFEDVIFGEETSRCLSMQDDSWIMVAHGEVFQCHCWVGGCEVEWIARYVGPQEKSLSYSCEVRLGNKSGCVLMLNKCHGWNNVSLDKCIAVDVDDVEKCLTAGRSSFMFRILKN